MAQARCNLTADAVVELHKVLDTRLSRIGLATQPVVARRIIELVSHPDAQVQDYARAIRTDPALSGRLLRLVNSAYFCQRQPVTALDRACTLLGIERLRSFSLGFYLSRGASNDPGAKYSRRVWGESVLRACLAAELARRLFPQLVSEAFIIGLMIDAALPLMAQLAGPAFTAIVDRDEPPSRSFVLEYRNLPFTHVDVIKVLALRWKLPELLCRPLEWHHTSPGDTARTEPVYRLQRVAYYVGAVRLSPVTGIPEEAAPLPTVAGRVLGVPGPELEDAISKAVVEYRSALSLFGDIAEGVAESEDLSIRVHQQLVDVMEGAIVRAVQAESRPEPRRFTLGGFTVEITPPENGTAVASLIDSSGSPLLTHRFRCTDFSPEQLINAMGLDLLPGDDPTVFNDFVRSLAA